MDETEKKLIESLLGKVSENLTKEQAVNAKTAKDFNVFEILGVAHLEVSTHSAFIANLLNPNGSHAQGTIFLKDFLNLLKIKDFDYRNVTVEVEKHVGELGRIDIFITDNANWAIAIENKVYAGLQENQLGRYMEFLNTCSTKNKKLIFLTLEESCNEDDTILNKQGVSDSDRDKYIHITYEKIKNWLKEYTNITQANVPINIMIIISQYINVIERLQQMNNEMDEWDKIIETPEVYDAYWKLVCSDFRKYRIIKLFNEIKKTLKGKITNTEIELSQNFDEAKREVGLTITLGENSGIFFGFESSDYWRPYISLYSNDNLKEKLKGMVLEGEWEIQGMHLYRKYLNDPQDVDEDIVKTLDENLSGNRDGAIDKRTKLIELLVELYKRANKSIQSND